MARLIGVFLVVAGVACAGLLAAPRMIDGVEMGRASACRADDTDGCLEEVEVLVKQKDSGLRTSFGPERWTLKPRGEDEETLRTPWLSEDLDIDTHVTLQRWEGEPVAVRMRGDDVHSLAWGINRWVLWVAGALALLLPGFTLLTRSAKPRLSGDRAPDAGAAVGAQLSATFIAALVMYPAYSSSGAVGAVLVLLVWLVVCGDLMIRGPRSRRPSGSAARGLT